MLQHLQIKNIVLIDEISIDFCDGLNIMTGETGAGKSIILGAINMALGNRVSKEIIRRDKEYGQVDVLFYIRQDEIIKKLDDIGINCDNSELLITRIIYRNGRNVCRANGQVVTLHLLKTISKMLIDIHGQHEHQSLLDDSKHIDLLDIFCEESLMPHKETLGILWEERKELKEEFNKINLNESERERKIDLLEYEFDEIEAVGLKDDEDTYLEEQQRILSHAQKIKNNCIKGYSSLVSGYNQENSAENFLDLALQSLAEISDYSEDVSNFYNILTDASALISDVARDIRTYGEGMEFDEEQVAEVEERLSLIYNLKRKYGQTIPEILTYQSKIKKELDIMHDNATYLEKIQQKINRVEEKMEVVCNAITEIRKDVAEQIEKEMIILLKTLQFEHADFFIEISERDNFSPNGLDVVQFQITTNKGEELRPLSEVASGGEMSRIMLAIKTILAQKDKIDTLVFDEIDTGISGRTAQKVAEKLAMISKYRQIVCITHLPQIAAMSDGHFLIEKQVKENKTHTYINELVGEHSINEIARLISGAEITDTSINTAKEIKAMAINFKTNL